VGVIRKCESQNPSSIWNNGIGTCKRNGSKLRKSEFRAYNVLLESLKKTHQIVFNEVCGEAGDVGKETVADCFAKLKYLYDTEPAYNGKKIFWSLAVL
jgi:hypothetical protein